MSSVFLTLEDTTLIHLDLRSFSPSFLHFELKIEEKSHAYGLGRF